MEDNRLDLVSLPAASRVKILTLSSFHIPIFMSTLTLSAGIMFIIRDAAATLDDSATSENIPEEDLPNFIHRAIWTIGISLAGAIASMTGLALLDEPVDRPDLLRVNNRYIRLSGRFVYILIVLLLPIKSDINAEIYLGVCSILMTFMIMWEWSSSLEKEWRWFEPKPKIHTISRGRSSDSEGEAR